MKAAVAAVPCSSQSLIVSAAVSGNHLYLSLKLYFDLRIHINERNMFVESSRD